MAALAVFPFSDAFAAKCGPHKKLDHHLKKKYKEHPVAIGRISDKAVLQLYMSKSGKFTVVTTMTNGISCIVAAGEAMDLIKPVAHAGPDV